MYVYLLFKDASILHLHKNTGNNNVSLVDFLVKYLRDHHRKSPYPYTILSFSDENSTKYI